MAVAGGDERLKISSEIHVNWKTEKEGKIWGSNTLTTRVREKEWRGAK